MENKSGVEEGYILSHAIYKDKDSLITLLTRKGKKTILVHGGEDPKSKNHEAVLVFNKVSLEVSENPLNGYYSCKGTTTLVNATSLYSNLPLSVSAQFASEILLSCFGGEETMPFDYFEALINGLLKGFDPLTLVFIFLFKALQSMGLGLECDECTACGKKKGLIAFSIENGGFICQDCLKDIDGPVNTDPVYLKVMRYGKLITAEQMEHAVLPKEETGRALSDLVQYLDDNMFRLKTFDMLKQPLKIV